MEDYKYKLSIIVPIYNVEKYIVDCLDSILNSDLPKGEYEVVLVNDGTTDNSGEIAKKYATNHSDFKYVEQENQGLSVARNTGIEVCAGEYIWFVDSDDKLYSNIGHLISLIEQYNKPDLLSFGLELRNYSDNKFVGLGSTHQEVPHNRVIIGRDAVIAGFMPSSICTFIIKRSLLINNSIKFYPGIAHQDAEMSYRMVSLAKSAVFIDYCYYIYCLHENSITCTSDLKKKKKLLLDDIIVAHSFKQFAEKMQSTDKELSDKIFAHSQSMVFGILMTMFKKRKIWKEVKINEEILTALKEKSLYPIHNRNLTLKQQMIRLILNQEWIYS